MSSWEEVIVDDISEYVTVGFVGSMASEYKDEGILFLRSQNIQPFKLNLSENQVKYISEKFHLKLSKSKLIEGDIAMVRTGYPGTCCVIPSDMGELNCSDLVIMRPDKSLVDSYFLCYFLNSPLGKASIDGNLVGAAQQHFNVGVAKKIKINLPKLPTQKKIASILSAYDDLIENNNQRITLLEDMTSEIYKEWFVRFRFPNYQNTKFLDKDGNEVAHGTKGAIPEGWERNKLEKIVDFRVDNRGRNPEYYCEKGIPVLDNHLITNSPFVNLSKAKRFLDESLYSNFLRKYLEPNDVLITLVGTVADIAMAPVEKCAIIQNTIGIRCNDLCNQYFLYEFLKINKQNIINKNRGSAQPNVKVGDLLSIKMSIPSKEILDKYELSISAFFEQIKTLGKKNQILQETRDLLLPRLISGKLSVEELEVEE